MAIQQDEKIRFAGDVSIDKIEIISLNGFGQDITNQVTGVEIYEDMFSPFISGIIVLKETLDYINLFPLIGEEYVNIKIHTPSFTDKDSIIDDQFVIYKVSNRIQTGDRNMAYELHFISRESLVDINKKVSRAYEGKISDIVQDIVTSKPHGLESTKTLNIEETRNGSKFVSNYWSPIKNINYVSETAQSPNGSPSYIFFENRTGFNFVSLNNLYDKQIRQNFTSDGFMRTINKDGSSDRDIEQEYKRIIDISIPVVYDYIERSQLGMYASKKISHDLVTKKYKVSNYDMRQDFDDYKHQNKYSAVSSSAILRPSMLHINTNRHYGLFNGYKDATNQGTIQQRLSLIKQAESTKVQITVPGRTDYTVGDRITLKLNKFNAIKNTDLEEDIIDNIFSGSYIISSINHVINREKHECYMEIIKDSFIVDFNNGGVR